MLTLNQTTEILKNFALKHKGVNSFYFGDLPERDASEKVIYPNVQAVLQGSDITDNVVSRRFTIVVSDLVNTDESNETHVLSDCELICYDLLNYLEQVETEGNIGMQVVKNGTLTDFTERFDDDVTGWFFDVTISSHIEGFSCDLPINSGNIFDANYIYVVQKSHREKYNLDTLLNLITPGCKIVEVDGITEGAACTALLAKEYINNDAPLFFANSDQYAEWDSNEFMYKMQETEADGGIVTFKAIHPKWSFAKINEQGYVTEVAEKNPISDNATVGFYYWKHGFEFVKYAEQMIVNNTRVNNEFYVCPVFNEAIADKKKIKAFNIDKLFGLGTPEDLRYFIENKNK